MRVLAHIDPVSLEHALVDRIESAAAGGRPVLVLVPTQRLGDHVQRRLLERRAAWVGVEVVDLGRLPAAILDRETVTAHPSLLSERQRTALVAGLLRGHPDGSWARHARRRSGTVRRLRAALDDLREAGIDPSAVLADAARGGEASRDLARLYVDHVASIERLTAESGLTDVAGLARLALPHASDYGRRFDAVLLHGTYEVVGAQLDLLRSVDAGDRLTVLLPADASGRVGAYARTFAARHLAAVDDDAIGRLDDAPGREAAASALAVLYDETARPDARPPVPCTFRTAQGAASEVAFAVREALAAVSAGCPAEEIVIAARELATYLPALEQALDDRGLPWTSPIRAPLRREPLVRDLLALLRVVDEDFPRGPTAELLRSTRLCWDALTGAGAPDRRIDGWSREARLIGGIDEWRVELAAWAADAPVDEDADEEERQTVRRRAEARAATARAAGAALDRLRLRLDPARPRRWADHRRLLVDTIDGLLRIVDPRDRAAADALVGLCDELPLLDRLPGAPPEVAFGEMRRRIEEAVDAAPWMPHRLDGGGLRVLDAMQLRGLTCRRLWLVGLNAGSFPRRGGVDPVLDDDARRALRETTGRPLPIAAERLDEERLLLAMTLGAATESVTVVWQRADESGRARSPSPAVREIARIVAGRPDPAALDPLALPTHPGEWLETAASVTGLLAPDERATVVALRGGAERLAPLADDEPALGRGLALLRATERFEPGPTPYDGAVGTLAVPQTLSVSALETLGGCPLRFFFSRVLRVGELREPASPWLLEPREMGTIGHRALELVYRRLRDDGLFDGGDADAAAVRAAELIPRAFDEAAGSLVARLRRRLPVLWDGQRAAWLAALAEFTRADLARLVGEGWRPVGLERPVEREVDFDGRRVVLRGRFDREMTAAPDVVDTSSDGRPERLIGDYKTTKDLARLVSERAIVRGHSLQMPLYRELAGAGSSVEVLRIGPAPEGAGADPAPRRIFEGFGDPAIEAGFRETLAVLLDLVRRGRYPLRPDAYVCGELCAYERACRRGHPPTLQRETRSPDVARYYRLSDKTDKLPLLDPAGGDRP